MINTFCDLLRSVICFNSDCKTCSCGGSLGLNVSDFVTVSMDDCEDNLMLFCVGCDRLGTNAMFFSLTGVL